MRRPAGLRSLRWLLAVGLALPPMVAGVAVVLAYWTAHGSGSAPASSGVLAVPAGVTATATSTRGTVTVSWSGEVGPDGATITRYRVQRIAGTVASDACGTTATSTLTAPPTSCTDTAVPDGTYTYAVSAVYHSWTATGVAGSAATVLPHAPTSVSLANGGGAGAAYVDGANAASVAVDVALNSTSLAADTVSLTLHDAGSAHTLTRTAAATAGSGTVHFTGLDLSGFADGTITASASVTDTIGGASGAVTATPTKDTVAPAAPTSVSISNSLGAGSAYINSTNAGSVGYAVVLPNNTNDSATDTIKVTLTSGATVSGSLASGLSSSGGTIAISALNATGLTDGSVAVSATATDLAGNISTATTTTTTKDTVAPATPTSVSLTNGLGSGSAYIDGTNRAAVNYNVVLPNSVNDSATDTVKVALTSGGSVSGSVTSGLSSAGGTVAVNGVDTTSLTDGSVSVSATATDLAGNVSAAATTTTTKDTVAPAAPTSVSIGNGLGSGSAYINSTNAASVNYSVVLPNNANDSATDTIKVTLTRVASVSGSIASGLTSAGGTVSVTAINAGSLTDGSVSVSATATDVAGNASTAATTTTSKDTVAPAAPTSVAISNGLGSGSSYISGANTAAVNYNVVVPSNANDSATDTIRVTLTSGASVNGSIASGLGAGGGTVGVTAINATSLTDGSVAVSATATDVAGNVSSAATTTTTKDTVAPVVTAVTLVNGGGIGSAYINSSNQSSISLDVALGSGSVSTDTVALSIHDAGSVHTVTPTAKAGTTGAGTVHFTLINLSSLSDGTITVAAVSTDVAGNVSTAVTATPTKDVAAPAIAVTSVTSPVTIGNQSNVQASGTTEAGATVSVTVTDTGGHSSPTVAATVTGTTWSATGIDTSQLVHGTITYTATATDAAGNTATGSKTASKDLICILFVCL